MDRVPRAGDRARGGGPETGRAAAEAEVAAGEAAGAGVAGGSVPDRAASGRVVSGSVASGSGASGGAAPGRAAPGSVAPGGAGEQAGRDRRLGWAALLVVWVLWGSTYFAIRGGWRRGRGADRSRRAERPRGADRPRARFWCSAAVVGMLLLAGGNGGVSVAERTVPSGLAAPLLATVPLWRSEE